MNKGDLIQIVFGKDAGKIDVALPQPWFDKAKELRVNPEFFVWSYIEDKIYGEPVNLLERYALLIIEEAEKITSES